MITIDDILVITKDKKYVLELVRLRVFFPYPLL